MSPKISGQYLVEGTPPAFLSPPPPNPPSSAVSISFFELLKDQMLECWIAWIHLSDHEVLITFLSLNNTSALKMWSLDNSWLKVSEFRDYLRQQISFYLELNEASAPSPSALWDILKAIIKGQIILYITRRKKDLCWQLRDLEGWIRDPQRYHFMSKNSSYSIHSPLCLGWDTDLSNEWRGRGQFSHQRQCWQKRKRRKINQERICTLHLG